MDCEKFESAMMDDLYGELDELTSAALKRHVASCTACAGLLEGMRATLQVAKVPRVQAPADLEARILRAAFPSPMAAVSAVSAVVHEAPPSARASSVVPFGRRAARALSIAGNWAMRPQTAMAAVFLVMIGTSGLLLRGRSSRAPAGAAVTVTEEGTPAPVAAAAPALDRSDRVGAPGTGPSGGSRERALLPSAASGMSANDTAPMASGVGLGGLGALRFGTTSSGAGLGAGGGAGAQGALAMNGPDDEPKSAARAGHAGAPPNAPSMVARKGAAPGAEDPFADSRAAGVGAATRDEAVAEAEPAEAAHAAPSFAQAPPASPRALARSVEPQSRPAGVAADSPAAPAAAPAAPVSPPSPAAAAAPPAYPGGPAPYAPPSFDDAMTAYKARRFDDASRSFDALAASDPRADLWAARAQREGNGCGAAVARFDQVAGRASGTPVGWDAALDAGRCYRFLGNAAVARARLTPLLKVPAYADRARAELLALARAPASSAASSRP